MGIFDRFFKKKELGLPKGLTWSFINGMWTPYSQNDSTYIEKAYKAIPVVYGIISEIIDRASDAPAEIYRVKNEKASKAYWNELSKGKNGRAMAYKAMAYEKLSDIDILDVFENPNPTMTGKELREASMGYLLLTGNAIEYNATLNMGLRKGNIKEIWSIPSPCVQMEFDENLRQPLKGYTVSYYGETIPRELITHVKYFNPIADTASINETFWGLSPLRSSNFLISQKRDSDVAQGSLFKNMTPAGLIVGNGNEGYGELSAEQAVAINDHFRQNHMGVYNAGDILECGVEPTDSKDI